MSLLNLLKSAQGGGGLSALASQLGMDEATTQALAEKITPAISTGMQQRAQQEGGLGTILSSLQGTGAAQYADDPAQAAAPAAQAQGQQFLTDIFGTPEASQELAAAAAAETGASVEQAQSALPALAAMLQGQLQQQAPDAEIQAAQASLQAGGDSAGAGIGDLMGMLQGGGGAGGLLGMAKGLLGGGGGAAQSGGLGGLMSMLDSDGDGSPLNDLAKRFMK